MVKFTRSIIGLASVALVNAQLYFNSSSSEVSSFSESSSLSSNSTLPPSSSTSSSFSSVSPTPNPTDVPYLEARFEDGALIFTAFIPGSLGPWNFVDLSTDGEGFVVQELTVGGVPQESAVLSEGYVAFEYTEQVAVGDWLEITYIATLVPNTGLTRITSSGTVVISTIDGKKLSKRALNTYPISASVDIKPQYSSVESSATNSEETTIWGYSTVTKTIDNIVTSYTTYCPLTTKSKDVITVTAHTSEGKTGGIVTYTKTKPHGGVDVVTVTTKVVESIATNSPPKSSPKPPPKPSPESPPKPSTESPSKPSPKPSPESSVLTVSTFEGAANRAVGGLLGLIPVAIFFF